MVQHCLIYYHILLVMHKENISGARLFPWGGISEFQHIDISVLERYKFVAEVHYVSLF